MVINVSGIDLSSSGSLHLNGGFSQPNAANILWNFYSTLVANSYIGDGEIHIANWTNEPPQNSYLNPELFCSC